MRLIVSNDVAPSLREFASWQFTASEDYTVDCARGRGLTRQFLDCAGDEGFPTVLPHIVASIAKRGGQLSGLEIGFLTQLSRLIAAAGTSPVVRPPLTLCSG